MGHMARVMLGGNLSIISDEGRTPFPNWPGGVVQLCTPFFVVYFFFWCVSIWTMRAKLRQNKHPTKQDTPNPMGGEADFLLGPMLCVLCAPWRQWQSWLEKTSDATCWSTMKFGIKMIARPTKTWTAKHSKNKKPYKSTQKQHTNNKQNNEKTRNFVPSTCPKKWNNKTIGQPSSAVTSSSSKKFPKHFHLA